MKYIKQLLLKQLIDDGWEIVSRDDDVEWWTDEHWKIKSVRQNWGYELILSFLLDPAYEGSKDAARVWIISAANQQPCGRFEAEEGLAVVYVQKGHAPTAVAQFVNEVNNLRNQSDD